MKLNLVIIRHGHAHMNSNSGDHGRNLSDRGKTEASATGLHLQKNALTPDLALVSDANRTQQTFEILKTYTPPKNHRIEADLYHIDAASLISGYLCCLEDEEKVLIIGHNPTVSDLTMALTQQPIHLNPADVVSLSVESGSWPESVSQIWDCDFHFQN